MDVTSARNGNAEVPVYFLKAKPRINHQKNGNIIYL
jgi:hypothetical protein